MAKSASFLSKKSTHSTKSTVVILDLDERCLYVLFDQIPLMEQIVNLSLVCKRFRTVLLKKWSEEPHLKIFSMPIPLDIYRERYRTYGSLHHFPQLAYNPAQTITGPYKSVPKLISFVNSRFTGLTELCVMFTEFTDKQINLLVNDTLRRQLQLLGIFRDYEETWAGLFPMMLQLRSLKHLVMFDVAESLVPLRPLFQRLETLHLTYFLNDLFHVVNMLGPTIRNLCLYAANFEQIDESDKPRILPEIAKNLKYLTLEQCLMDHHHKATTDVPMVNYITRNFSALTEVDIPMGAGIKIETALRLLKNLHSLLTLHISFEDSDPLLNITSDSKAASLQMPSTRRLFLHKSLGSCTKRLHYFGIIFPNLEYLTLRYCPLYCKKGHAKEPCAKCALDLKKWAFDSFEELRGFTVYSQKVQATFNLRSSGLAGVNSVVQQVERFINPKFERNTTKPLKLVSTSTSKDYVFVDENRARELETADSGFVLMPIGAEARQVNAIFVQRNGNSTASRSNASNSTEGRAAAISTPSNSAASPSSSPISSLDDRTLNLIFSYFPLQAKLTTVSLVCKDWAAIVSKECRQLTQLHVFPNLAELQKFYDLYHSLACFNTLPGLSADKSAMIIGPRSGAIADFICYLHHKFPLIRQLVLYCSKQWTEENIVQIIGPPWRHQLELLGIFKEPHQRDNFRWNLIYPAICLTKSKMKHLILCDIATQRPDSLKELFAKLETLYLGYYGDDLLELVNGCGKQLRRLALFHPALNRLNGHQLEVTIKSKVARNLVHLTLESSLFDEAESGLPGLKVLDFIVQNFDSLRVLDIALSQIKFQTILSQLQKRPSLRSLRIRFDDPELDPLTSFTSEEVVRKMGIVCPGICQLALQNPLGPTGSTLEKFALLSQVFPRLKYLNLVACPLYCRPVGSHSTAPCVLCDSQLLEVLRKRFPKLQRYRQMRFNERKVSAASGEVTVAYEPQCDLWNFFRDGEVYFHGEEV